MKGASEVNRLGSKAKATHWVREENREMLGRLARRYLLILSAALAIAGQAHAHRSQSVLSSLQWNAETSQIEIVHRLHTDDVEIGLAAPQASDDVMDLSRDSSREKLLAYVEASFTILVDDEALQIETVGVELRGQETHVRQLVNISNAPDELQIDNRLLRDVFSDQANLVNIRMAARTRTVIFSGADRLKHVKNLLG